MSTAPRTPGLARPDRFESRVRTRTNYPVAVPDRTIDPTLRGALIEERDRLLAQIASLEPGHGTSPDFDDNFADSGQVAAEQGENQVLARSEEHTSELPSLMRTSYAAVCLKK